MIAISYKALKSKFKDYTNRTVQYNNKTHCYTVYVKWSMHQFLKKINNCTCCPYIIVNIRFIVKDHLKVIST